MSKGWDSIALKKLKALTGKGLSTSEIGKRLGMSKNAIVGKLNRLGWNAKAGGAASAEVTEKTISGAEKDTTNNRMELMAAISGLEALKERCAVTLYSDSKYMIDAIEKKWVYSWRDKGWKKADKSPALNPDLWEKLLKLIEKHDIKFVWVKGHNGHDYNERCDKLGVNAYKQENLLEEI